MPPQLLGPHLRLYIEILQGHIVCVYLGYHAPFHKECPKYHGHKRDPGMTPGTCGANGKNAQMIIVWKWTLGIGNTSLAQELGVMRVKPWAMRRSSRVDSKMLKTPHLKVWTRRYDNLSEVLFWDNALKQKWHGSGSQDCKGLNRHNFFNTCLNGASELSINIYVKRRRRYSGHMWALVSITHAHLSLRRTLSGSEQLTYIIVSSPALRNLIPISMVNWYAWHLFFIKLNLKY